MVNRKHHTDDKYPAAQAPSDSYMCMYIGYFFLTVFHHVYLFARATFARTLKDVDRGRPSVVDVWAPCVQCVARGVRSKLFFVGGYWMRRFPGFSLCGAVLCYNTPYLSFQNCWCFLLILRTRYRVENGTALCRSSGFPV